MTDEQNDPQHDERDEESGGTEIPVEIVDDAEQTEETSTGGGADSTPDGESSEADPGGGAEAENGDAASDSPTGGRDADGAAPPREELRAEVEQLRAELESVREERDELRGRVDDLEEERDEIEERMLRVAADFENYKKRAEKRKEELETYKSEDLVTALLPTIDNLERAIDHAGEGGDESIADGVEMVLDKLHTTLHDHGVESFDAEGDPFDPERHEAIQQVETDDYEPGTVVDQFQKGYVLHDRLLRPAVVSVAEASADDHDESGDGEESGGTDADGDETAPGREGATGAGEGD